MSGAEPCTASKIAIFFPMFAPGVTPRPPGLYLATVGVAVTLLGGALVFAEGAIIGVGVPPLGALAVAAFLGAPTGVVLALLLVTQASNKVEAFAVMKITTTIGLVPVAGWFVLEPMQYAAGVVPPYWACKIWWNAQTGAPWSWLVLPGIVVSALWLAVLVRRFRAVVAP